MNKTVTVNIGGIVFHIDENAYDKFKFYLESIRGHFTSEEGRDEIMQDIEARIAEMFQERIRDAKQVITLEDVDVVTRQMGKPEDFAGEEEKESPRTMPPMEGQLKRRLYRNPDDKLLGGVCSGISSYFDLDPVWIRLAFVFIFFAFGSGFLLYIILWIVIPEAKTTTEKLQMKGEPVTVSNIEKNIKEEMGQVRSRINDFGKGTGKKAGTAIGRIFEAIGEVIRFIFIAIGKLIAILFLFIGLLVAFCMVVSLLALIGIPGTTYPDLWRHTFQTGFQFALAFVSVVIVVGIPFLMLAYAGARMLFNIRKSSRVVSFTALGLWLVAAGILLVLGLKVASQFHDDATVRKEVVLSPPSSKVIKLQTGSGTKKEKDYFGWGSPEAIFDHELSIQDSMLFSNEIKLDIVKSPDSLFSLTEMLYSRGSSGLAAKENAVRIRYGFSQEDSLISFNNYFTLDRAETYRGQKVQLVLKVPVGGRIFLDSSLDHFIYDIDNINDILDHSMLGRTWEMTGKGLKCLDCDGTEDVLGSGNDDDENSSIHIDKNGVHISQPDGDKVVIDSNGVYIREDGKDVIRIDGSGVHRKKNTGTSNQEPSPPAAPANPI